MLDTDNIIDKPKVVSQSPSQKLTIWFSLKSQCPEKKQIYVKLFLGGAASSIYDFFLSSFAVRLSQVLKDIIL